MFIGVVLSQANRSRLIRSILMADSLLQPPRRDPVRAWLTTY
jgi:hypothetical protein